MNAEILEYAADELLALAMISKTSIIIVEGYDDVPIYERVSDSIGKKCLVFASENILSTKAGCDGVIANIEMIRETANGVAVELYILGIIDRDARFYRKTIPDDTAILVLDSYSIESHFVSLSSIQFLIPKLTRVTSRLLKESLCAEIYDGVCNKIGYLRLVSLEALKNACVTEYEAEFGYGDTIKSILNRNLHVTIEAKREALEEFGRNHEITAGWEGLLKICKGKWLFEIFTDELQEFIKELPLSCQLGKIEQCQFCAKGTHAKCLYKNPSFFSSDIMRTQLLHNVECAELGYVRDRMSQLIH